MRLRDLARGFMAEKVGELDRNEVVPARVIGDTYASYTVFSGFWRRQDLDSLLPIHGHPHGRSMT